VGTDCRAAGIKVSLVKPQLTIPSARVNITEKRVLSGVRGFIEGNFYYMQILPFNIMPFDCGY
jgi:hypothetical protein